MKFTKEETPTIMDGKVIRWKLENVNWPNKPEISASRNGVLISGAWPVVSSREPIDQIISQLNEAYSVHVKLKKF